MSHQVHVVGHGESVFGMVRNHTAVHSPIGKNIVIGRSGCHRAGSIVVVFTGSADSAVGGIVSSNRHREDFVGSDGEIAFPSFFAIDGGVVQDDGVAQSHALIEAELET